jgi:hypothetical protein
MAVPHKQLIRAGIDKASRLVAPALVYSLYEVISLEGGCARLSNGSLFPLPPGKPDSGVRCLEFCVCTIGPELEKTVGHLTTAGNVSDGLFLDAAGVAFLEALTRKAHRFLRDFAKQRLLHSSYGIRPGCSKMNISAQRQLFDLVDASLIGMKLNESCLMIPAKSLSFFTKWTTSKAAEDMGGECASCELSNCIYRGTETIDQ